MNPDVNGPLFEQIHASKCSADGTLISLLMSDIAGHQVNLWFPTKLSGALVMVLNRVTSRAIEILARKYGSEDNARKAIGFASAPIEAFTVAVVAASNSLDVKIGMHLKMKGGVTLSLDLEPQLACQLGKELLAQASDIPKNPRPGKPS